MSFLDPKETVISIELTQHGKRLLSQGKFNPKYYSFCDDDILYDSLYASITESQNSVSDRIKESPQLSPHYNFEGVETSFKKYKKMLNDDTLKEVDNKQEENYFVYSLGKSEIGSQKYPYLNVNFYKGEITGSTTFLSSSVYPHIRIPQLTCSIDFDAEIGSIYHDTKLESSEEIDRKIYDDGSYIYLEDDFLLLELFEEGTPFEEENFEIEIFKIEEDIDVSNKKRLVPLYFALQKKKDNEIFVPEKVIKRDGIELTKEDAEYYFDIYVDNEIDRDIFCKLAKDLKNKNIIIDERFKCEDKEKVGEKNIYKKSKEFDEEEC